MNLQWIQDNDNLWHATHCPDLGYFVIRAPFDGPSQWAASCSVKHGAFKFIFTVKDHGTLEDCKAACEAHVKAGVYTPMIGTPPVALPAGPKFHNLQINLGSQPSPPVIISDILATAEPEWIQCYGCLRVWFGLWDHDPQFAALLEKNIVIKPTFTIGPLRCDSCGSDQIHLTTDATPYECLARN